MSGIKGVSKITKRESAENSDEQAKGKVGGKSQPKTQQHQLSSQVRPMTFDKESIKKILKENPKLIFVASFVMILNKIINWIGKFSKRFVEFSDLAISYLTRPDNDPKRNEAMQQVRAPAVFGIWVAVVSIFIFFVWGGLAPLDSAANSEQGLAKIVLEKNKTTIQHLEGGIVEEVLVKDGDHVKKGQVLVKLNPKSAQAHKEIYESKLYNAIATQDRLLAQMNRDEQIKFSDEILKHAGEKHVANIINNQQKYFHSYMSAYAGSVNARREKVAQYKSSIETAITRAASTKEQVKLMKETHDALLKLSKDGYASKHDINTSQIKVSETETQLHEAEAKISQLKNALAEEELNIENYKSENMSRLNAELKETQDRIVENKELLIERSDVLERAEITAPLDGIVNQMPINIVKGGVIGHNGMICEIIPQTENLIVEALMNPMDIDVVRVGQVAHVRLVVFKSRVVPVLNGKVVRISPDLVTENTPRGPVQGYRARIEIDKGDLEVVSNTKGVELYPGMPVNVSVVIGTRTLLRYLLDPITQTFEKALIEQ